MLFRGKNTPHLYILESIPSLGLERRLRCYEDLQDVMSSWDHENRNEFILRTSDSSQNLNDLNLDHVPNRAPRDITVSMYHSQVQGKWKKRYVTLMAMGQIFISKRRNSTLSDKSATSVCHLSNSEIYSRLAKSDKTLRPPKKHCYAIKSQQKSSKFQDIRESLHFFCTGDDRIAETWSSTVQKWRSWYLVNRMGEGRVRVNISAGDYDSNIYEMAFSTGGIPVNKRQDEPFRATRRLSYEAYGEIQPRQIPFFLRHGGGETQDFHHNHHHHSVKNHEPQVQAFTLGNGFSQHLRSQHLNQAHRKPGHLSSHSRPALETDRLYNPASGNHREHSYTKPLLDFTPSFREAPQWDKSIKGHGVRGKAGVPLVDYATGPKLAGAEIPDVNVTLFRRNHSK